MTVDWLAYNESYKQWQRDNLPKRECQEYLKYFLESYLYNLEWHPKLSSAEVLDLYTRSTDKAAYYTQYWLNLQLRK